MMLPYGGGCLCGRIRYECDAEPPYTYICHCRDCQKAHGSAFSPGLMVPRAALRITQGAPKDYTSKAASGFNVTRRFCPDCGSMLFVRLWRAPDMIVITAGTLDDPSWFRPKRHVWSQSELAWARIDDQVERQIS